MVESTHLNERLSAATILIELGKPEMAIPVLKALIASDDMAMRSRARRLLAKVADADELP